MQTDPSSRAKFPFRYAFVCRLKGSRPNVPSPENLKSYINLVKNVDNALHSEIQACHEEQGHGDGHIVFVFSFRRKDVYERCKERRGGEGPLKNLERQLFEYVKAVQLFTTLPADSAMANVSAWNSFGPGIHSPV